ncbi:MAG: hypothetical protein PHQ75_15360 [Thermoguttaceae bacterium]|nr:hypothetical protein [Thermoguttaceae bacterium]
MNEVVSNIAFSPIEWTNELGAFTLLNGVVGDAAIKAVFLQSGEVTLFDLGQLNNMTYGELLDVRQAYISHTHFDHIVGFDSLLRATFPLNRPLTFAGPVGIATQLSCRMKGYTWNLAAPDQVDHTIREIDDHGTVRSFHLTNTNNFEPVETDNEPLRTDPLNPNLFDAPVAYVGSLTGGLRTYAVVLDHVGIPSVAYCCVSDAKLKFNPELLPSLGLKPGAWVGQFQKAYLNGELDREFPVGQRTATVQELADKLLEIKPGKKFCYLTDFGFTPENLERVRPFIRNATSLAIESNFRDGQEVQASENGHLTTRQAVSLIKESGASSFRTFHLSNSFSDCAGEILAEIASMYDDKQV